ncbi:MAG: nucleotidyltransferase family protein [Anaerolineae bacterium]|nr:nucleotidyltransferase family protein [Anaerolineae bacterium]
MLTAEQILATLEQHREALHELGVERIGLFGSFRRGEADQGSDIDLLVRLRTLSFFTGYMRVLLYLEEVFGRPVDLVLENSVREELRQQIMDEVLYAEGV